MTERYTLTLGLAVSQNELEKKLGSLPEFVRSGVLRGSSGLLERDISRLGHGRKGAAWPFRPFPPKGSSGSRPARILGCSARSWNGIKLIVEMLTPAQYEAIGRLALAFNQVEVAFEIYIAYILNVPERSVGEVLAEEGMFRQRAERFKKVLQSIGKERPILSEHLDPILQLVKQAKQLSDKRNQYMHAFVVRDLQTDRPRLRVGTADLDCDEARISHLAGHADVLAVQLHMLCGDLLMLLDEQRKSQ